MIDANMKLHTVTIKDTDAAFLESLPWNDLKMAGPTSQPRLSDAQLAVVLDDALRPIACRLDIVNDQARGGWCIFLRPENFLVILLAGPFATRGDAEAVLVREGVKS